MESDWRHSLIRDKRAYLTECLANDSDVCQKSVT